MSSAQPPEPSNVLRPQDGWNGVERRSTDKRVRTLVTSVDELITSVDRLHGEVSSKPDRGEVVSRRTIGRTVIAMLAIMFVTVYLAIVFHEGYRDVCSLSPVLTGDAPPAWCDRIPGLHLTEPQDGDGEGVANR